jgi:hypothetical protein
MPSFGGEVKPSVPCCRFAARKRTLRFTWKLESAGKIDRPFLAQFCPSLTEVSHVAWRGAPLEMTDGTKGGAQRANSLRPRCFGEVDPETATHIYLSILEVLFCQSVKHSLQFGLDLLNGIKPASFQLQFQFLEIGRSHRVPNQESTVGGGWQPLYVLPETSGWGRSAVRILGTNLAATPVRNTTTYFIPTHLWRWKREAVLEGWHLNYRCWWITLKKAYNMLWYVVSSFLHNW